MASAKVSGLTMVGRFVPNPERVRFGFANAVQNAFGFLARYGFSCEESEVTLVRYRASDREIRLYHGRGSYEVGFEARFDRILGHFSMYCLLTACGHSSRTSEIYIAGSSIERMQESIERYARLAEACLDAVLRGDRVTIDDVVETHALLQREARNRIVIEQTRREIAPAWKRGDFGAVVGLFEKLARCTVLSPAEQKKLAIARSKL